jgi:hypothetical protein
LSNGLTRKKFASFTAVAPGNTLSFIWLEYASNIEVVLKNTTPLLAFLFNLLFFYFNSIRKEF